MKQRERPQMNADERRSERANLFRAHATGPQGLPAKRLLARRLSAHEQHCSESSIGPLVLPAKRLVAWRFSAGESLCSSGPEGLSAKRLLARRFSAGNRVESRMVARFSGLECSWLQPIASNPSVSERQNKERLKPASRSPLKRAMSLISNAFPALKRRARSRFAGRPCGPMEHRE